MQGQQQHQAGDHIDGNGGQHQSWCSCVQSGHHQPAGAGSPHQQPVETHIQANTGHGDAEGGLPVTQRVKHPHQHITRQIGRHAQAVGHQDPDDQLGCSGIKAAALINQRHDRSRQRDHQRPQRQHAGVAEHHPLADASNQLVALLRCAQPREDRQQGHQKHVGENPERGLHQQPGIPQTSCGASDATGEKQVGINIDLQHPGGERGGPHHLQHLADASLPPVEVQPQLP